MKVIAFTGSLRKASYNHALLVTAKEMAPAGMEIEIFDVGQFPLYNQDLEVNFPQVVADFKAKVVAADAVLIATPEFNFSVPGVLKNALDWGSRPYGQNCFNDKPVAIMGAAYSMGGSGKAQYHLRQIFVELNMHAMNKPELMIPVPHEKFDADGKLTDERVRENLKLFLDAFVVWTARLK